MWWALFLLLLSPPSLSSNILPQIDISTNEWRSFRFLQDSALPTVLCSDPRADSASAAVAVGTGLYDDPRQLQGLAHFLEHMVFLGSERFPSPGGFRELLASHNGQSNAWTAGTETNFYFQVASPALDETLTHFARFFIDPLLLNSSAAAEVSAVNAEHEKNVNNDGWRANEIRARAAIPESPVHMFHTGNRHTLWQRPISQEGIDVAGRLRAFHEQHYVAAASALAVVGPHSLDRLAEIARQAFADADGSKALPKLASRRLLSPYPKGRRGGRLYRFASLSDTRTITILVQLPRLHDDFDTKPLRFAASLLKWGGKGGLPYLLRRARLASSVDAAVEVEEEAYDTFLLELELTDAGYAQMTRTLAIVFGFVRHVLGSLPRTTAYDRTNAVISYWHDCATAAGFQWQFPAAASSPASLATSLVGSLRRIGPASRLLSAPVLYGAEANVTALRVVFEALADPDRLLFFLSSRDALPEAEALSADERERRAHSQQEKLESTEWPNDVSEHADVTEDDNEEKEGQVYVEPYYMIPYLWRSLSPEERDSWSRDPAAPEPALAALSLPPPNPYFPRSFEFITDVKEPPPSKEALVAPDFAQSKTLSEPVARRVFQNGSVSAWHASDLINFPEPRASVRLRFRSPGLERATAEEAVLADLAQALFIEAASTELFASVAAGVSISASVGRSSIELSFSGFSDRLSDVAVDAARLAAKLPLDEQRELVIDMRERVLSGYETDLTQSLALMAARGDLKAMTSSPAAWSTEERLAVAAASPVLAGDDGELLFERLASFWRNRVFSSYDSIEMLGFGNLLPQDVVNLAERVMSPDVWGAPSMLAFPGSVSPVRAAILPPKSAWLYRRRASSKTESNAAVIALFQIGRVPGRLSPSEQAVLQIASPSLDSLSFGQLRTKESLGYIVWGMAGADISRSTGGGGGGYIRIEVQGPSAQAWQLDNRIDEFLETVLRPAWLNLTSDPVAWHDAVEAAVSSRRERASSVAQQADRLWFQIVTGRQDFNAAERDVQAIRRLKPSSLMSLYDSFIARDAPLRRRFSFFLEPSSGPLLGPDGDPSRASGPWAKFTQPGVTLASVLAQYHGHVLGTDDRYSSTKHHLFPLSRPTLSAKSDLAEYDGNLGDDASLSPLDGVAQGTECDATLATVLGTLCIVQWLAVCICVCVQRCSGRSRKRINETSLFDASGSLHSKIKPSEPRRKSNQFSPMQKIKSALSTKSTTYKKEF